MSLRDELLDKAVAGLLTQAEAAQLRDIIRKEETDARLRALIALGVGAAAGATLPKLLGLDIFDDLLEVKTLEVEELPPESQQTSAGMQRSSGMGPSEYTPPPPEDALEEEMETAREATAPGQVGAQPMTAPPPMGERRRSRRPPPIRRV